MKKLIAVTVLSGFPVACGSLPSSPDSLESTVAANDASVTASAKRPKRPAPPPPTCDVESGDVHLDGIHLAVVGTGDGYVQLRADAVVLDGSDRLTPCFTPEWSFGPENRGASLAVDLDPQVATLAAPAGKYDVQASWQMGDGRKIVSSLPVVID